MKKIIQLFIVFAGLLVLASCKKVENKIFFEGGKDPVLTVSAMNVSLEPGNESKEALRLNWTNPDYMFTTGTSSHDVTYTVEFDVEGGNFTSANKKEIVIAKELSKIFTVAELNSFLGNTMKLQTEPRKTYVLEIRVIASIGSAVKKYSTVSKITTSPFNPPPKVALPSSGNLYITGGATPGDWMSGGAAELLSQKFTKISNTEYEIVVRLNAGGSYLFVPIYGDWGDKYGIAVKNDPALVNGGDFSRGSNDIMAPAKTANYKIRVNFQIGIFTVVEQP